MSRLSSAWVPGEHLDEQEMSIRVSWINTRVNQVVGTITKSCASGNS
jgi:hypothetical protein